MGRRSEKTKTAVAPEVFSGGESKEGDGVMEPGCVPDDGSHHEKLRKTDGKNGKEQRGPNGAHGEDSGMEEEEEEEGNLDIHQPSVVLEEHVHDQAEVKELEQKEVEGEGEEQKEVVAQGAGIQDEGKKLSKSAKKKLMKAERYKEFKVQRKAMEKEKRHQETQRKRREWEEKVATLTEEELEKAKAEKLNSRKERKDEQKSRKERLREAMTTGQNLVIDLEFCELMTPNEVTSLIQQVMYCYAANGRAAEPCRMTLTGCDGRIRTELEKISGFENWLMHRKVQSYLEVFEERKQDLVYLTADSENIVESLDPSKIYIIGGLVDRNRWKNVTFDKATKQGIATAKLPVGDHLKMLGSQVLTVNQVMELLLCFMQVKDWKSALTKVVPLRKRAAETVSSNARKQQA